MSIKLRVEGIIKYRRALERYQTKLRKALLKAQEETAKEYMKLVNQEFDNYPDAEMFKIKVLRHFDQMIESHTYKMRHGLEIRQIAGDSYVGWFDDNPYYAKYVLLGTWKMLPRNPLLEALDELGIEYDSVLPIMSRGFDDPIIAKAYFEGVKVNFNSLIITRTGRMRETLEMRKVGDKWRVGWFENAPEYAKYVLMGTEKMFPRNPLIHAYNHEYLLKFMEKVLREEMGVAA